MAGHVLYGVFLLILAFLALSNWNGLNALIKTSAGSTDTTIRTLQGR